MCYVETDFFEEKALKKIEGNLLTLRKCDILFLVKFASSICRNENAEACLLKIFEKIPAGCILIYIDNNSEYFTSWFWNILNQNDSFTILDKSKNPKWYPKFSEQKSEFNSYINKFNWNPTVQLSLQFIIAEKSGKLRQK